MRRCHVCDGQCAPHRVCAAFRVQIWTHFDQHCSGYIHIAVVRRFLRRLGPPLGGPRTCWGVPCLLQVARTHRCLRLVLCAIAVAVTLFNRWFLRVEVALLQDDPNNPFVSFNRMLEALVKLHVSYNVSAFVLAGGIFVGRLLGPVCPPPCECVPSLCCFLLFPTQSLLVRERIERDILDCTAHHSYSALRIQNQWRIFASKREKEARARKRFQKAVQKSMLANIAISLVAKTAFGASAAGKGGSSSGNSSSSAAAAATVTVSSSLTSDSEGGFGRKRRSALSSPSAGNKARGQHISLFASSDTRRVSTGRRSSAVAPARTIVKTSSPAHSGGTSAAASGPSSPNQRVADMMSSIMPSGTPPRKV